MRIHIVAFLILVSCLNVFSKVSAQKISLQFKQVELETVFKAIERQTDYGFAYGVALLANSERVTVQLKDVSLTEALDHIFANLPYKYEIVNKTILIKAKVQPSKQTIPEKSKPMRITGKVTDMNSSALIGVSVRLRGTNIGTITDQNGSYQIEGEPDGILIFTFVGFRAMQIKINNQSEINLTLIEYTSELRETVVKGYYNTTKELNTGNVSTVKADEIARQPVGDPMAALIGRVPGLNVQQTSGVNGRMFNVRLRGQNSLDNGKDPLFIVDGVQYNSTPLNTSNSTFTAGGLASPFSYLNPADIESIEVLKDADATAIYGSRGANGVILIATKKAKDGKLELDTRFYSGISEAPRRIKFMNTQEYLAMRNEAFANDKKNPGAADHDLNGNWDTTRYTDWQKYLIGGTAPAHDASMGLTMGSKTTAFRIGAGYRSEGTIYPSDFRSKRASVNFSASHAAMNNKFNLNFTGSYGYSQNDLPFPDVEQSITLAPVAPNPYSNDGSLNWANSTWVNPMAVFNRTALEKAKNLVSNISVSYKILKTLTFKTSFGYTFTNFKQRNLRPWSSFNPSLTAPLPTTSRLHSVINNDIRTFVIEPQLSYSESVLNGDVDLLLGSTLQGSSGDYFGFSANGFASDAIMRNLAAATTIAGVTQSHTDYKYSALFARIGYSFQRKYVLNLTGRRDASSRFGPGKKAGNFGAIGAAWIFTNENFLKGASTVLSFGKLRFSYGTTGNDQLGEYKYLNTYSIYNVAYQGNSSLIPTQLTNPLYGWERVNKLEFGLELGFFDGRVNLNSSVYRNRTNNQLVQIPLPFTTGFDKIRANLPATIENSGFEFDARSVNIDKSNFSWSTSVNLTIPRNKLVSFPGIASSSYANRFVVGSPINTLTFLYQYTGVDPTTGLFTFKDVNGDGSLSTTQDYQPIFIGQNFYGGIYNIFKVGPVEFDFHVQFTKQNGYAYLFAGNAGSFAGGRGNQQAKILQRDHQPFSATNSAIFLNGALFSSSTGIITDASFIRLKNVGIYYKLPILKRSLKLSKLFLQGQNIATFSNYVGFDPESPSGNVIIPPLRTIVAGIQLTL